MDDREKEQWDSTFQLNEDQAGQNPTDDPASGSGNGGQYLRVSVPSSEGKAVWHLGKETSVVGHAGFTFSTAGNFYTSSVATTLFQSNTQTVFQSNGTAYRFADQALNVYAHANLNLGAKGGVIIASLSGLSETVKPQSDQGSSIEAVTLFQHVVTTRNEIYNQIQTEKNWASAIAGTIGGIKSALGVTWTPWSLWFFPSLTAVLNMANAAITTTTGWINLSNGGGTVTSDAGSVGAQSPADSGAPGGDSGNPYATADSYTQLGGGAGKNISALNQGNRELSERQAPRTTSWQQQNTIQTAQNDLSTSKTNLDTARSNHAQSQAALTTAQTNAVDSMHQLLANQNDPNVVAMDNQRTAELNTARDTHEANTKALKTAENDVSTKQKTLDGANAEGRNAEQSASHGLGSANFWKKSSELFDFGGAVVGTVASVKGLTDAINATPSSSIPGVTLITDDDIFLGSSKKGITGIAPGGVSFVAPNVGGFSVITGGGASFQSAIKTEVFSLVSVTMEGGFSADIVGCAAVGVTSKMRDVNIVGKQVNIGAQASDVTTLMVKSRFNPMKQRPTQELNIRVIESGQIDFYIKEAKKHVKLTPTEVVSTFEGNTVTQNDQGTHLKSDKKIVLKCKKITVDAGSGEVKLHAKTSAFESQLDVTSGSASFKVTTTGVENKSGAGVSTTAGITTMG